MPEVVHLAHDLGARSKALRTRVAGAMRLAHRSLEVHARNVSYVSDLWVSRAIEHAWSLLCVGDAMGPFVSRSPVQLAGAGAVNVNRAIAACESDRMAVPEFIADAQALLLGLFWLASAARSAP